MEHKIKTSRTSPEKVIEPAYSHAAFDNGQTFAEKKNVPLYCGEYGVIDQAPIEDTVRWFEDIHATFEKYGIGRAVWNYKQKDFGIVDPHYEEILDEVVKNL